VFTTQVPKTAENFRCPCTGEKGVQLNYKNSILHKIDQAFVAHGGDITKRNGTGVASIYGGKFADEQIWYSHTHPGVMTMATKGPDSNGCQFYICFANTEFLD